MVRFYPRFYFRDTSADNCYSYYSILLISCNYLNIGISVWFCATVGGLADDAFTAGCPPNSIKEYSTAFCNQRRLYRLPIDIVESHVFIWVALSYSHYHYCSDRYTCLSGVFTPLTFYYHLRANGVRDVPYILA